MEMILTGEPIKAEEAARSGLVSRVLPAAELLPEAIRVAEKIASFSKPVGSRLFLFVALLCALLGFTLTRVGV